MSLKDIYGVVDNSLDKICNPLAITNRNGFGKLHHKFIYTENSAVVATTFDDQFTDVPWDKIRALRVLDHPFTSMEIFTAQLDHQIKTTENYSVIGIDLPLFAYQLQQWNNAQLLLPESDRDNLVDFIMKWVVPGLVNEYIDIAVRNRLYYIVNREPMPYERHERSFVIGYEGVIEKPLKTIISSIKTSNKPYIKGLSEIPLIYSPDYLTAMPMCIGSSNSYTYWVMFYTFVNWAFPLTFMVDNSKGNATNAVTILHKVDRFVNDHSRLTHMSPAMLDATMLKYKKIKEFFENV
jgi:hypothetical protein